MTKIADSVFNCERDDFSWEPTTVGINDITGRIVLNGVNVNTTH